MVNIVQSIYLYMVNHIVQCNHSKGQESCDRWTGDEPEDLSKISRIPQGGWTAATGGPVHIPGVLSTIRRPHQKGG